MAHLDHSLIAGSPNFAALGREALDEILALATPLRVPRRDVAFRQGEAAERFFMLLHGRLGLTLLTPRSEQVLMRYVAPGEMFGVAMAIGVDAYPETTTAVVDSLALAWPNSAWEDLIQRYPCLAVNVLRTLGACVLDLHKRVLDLSTQRVEQRIAGAVLQLAQQAGCKTENGVLIDFPISRQDIAEMTATTLHTVSRTLRAWEVKGLVECSRLRVVVRNAQDLLTFTTNKN